ncbi:MAG: 6,7-dimethyl-8-ribityllumazine synthase [Lentisphaerae bacterium]|jgi:6,7-dimethyl-8-ribityllumazine synthase|nr:6,7-dimethyl-8-ribityllumazine synthase [Lentisphaerota bacterium]
MTNEIKAYEGSLIAKGLRFGIVCARFNEFFVSKLLGGAVDCLLRHGAAEKDIETAWVPGSYEIPLVVQRMAASGRYDAIIALGVVIQGSTAHASYVNAEVSKGLAQVMLASGLPVIYGVVTTENIEQAIERSGSKAGNRGAAAAESAIEMADLMRKLPVAK